MSALKNVVLLSALTLAGSAMAAPVFVGNIDFNDSYGSNTVAGGEFYAHVSNWTGGTPAATGSNFQFGQLAGPGNFETFCLEKFEDLLLSGAPNGLPYRADANTETIADGQPYNSGGLGGAHDALDARTAYLYAHFINRNLVSGYDYGNGAQRTSDADDLQRAMWFIEQEDATALTGKALAYYNEANAAVVSGQWNGLGNVRVLNIYTVNLQGVRTEYQDVLYMTTVIPLPTGAAMAGLGLGGLAVVRRRRTR